MVRSRIHVTPQQHQHGVTRSLLQTDRVGSQKCPSRPSFHKALFWFKKLSKWMDAAHLEYEELGLPLSWSSSSWRRSSSASSCSWSKDEEGETLLIFAQTYNSFFKSIRKCKYLISKKIILYFFHVGQFF